MNNLKILVAENDAKILFAFKRVLENENCICIQSTSISEALKKVPLEKPQAVFLDVSRSESEYEMISDTIAKMQGLVPVIIVSSNVTEELKNFATSINALDVIEKPLKVKRVRHCLDKIKENIITKT